MSCLRRLNRGEIADGETALLAAEPIMEAPALATVRRYAQDQAAKGRVVIFIAPGGGRPYRLAEQLGELLFCHQRLPRSADGGTLGVQKGCFALLITLRTKVKQNPMKRA